MTFAAFKQQVKSLTFPIGEPENLVAIDDEFIANALTDIQQYVPEYRERNVLLIPYHKTKYVCGLTLLSAPNGIIRRIYTQSSNPCCKVFYRRSSLAKLRYMSAVERLEVPAHAEPTQPAGVSADQFGVEVPDVSADSTMGRANEGYWALDGCKLYLFPYIQSTEDVVVEYSGIKSEYVDTDTLYESGARLVPAVRARLLRDIARLVDGDDAAALKFDAIYRDQLGDLFHWAQQKVNGTWAEEDRFPTITNGCLASEALTSTSAPPPDPAPTEVESVFAIIGSYGTGAVDGFNVSSLVASWSPEYVITTGENNLTGLLSYDGAVGIRYHPYLFPYTGAYGSGAADRNRFWPSLGPTDRTTAAMLTEYQKFFTGLPLANKLFYTRIEGPVQFFFVDSGFDSGGTNQQPSGNAASSSQAEWLRLELLASIAPFKVVVLCHPPYSSVGGGYATLRWPFKAWGATLVVSGLKRVYERVIVDTLQYITNGLGGATLSDSFDATPVGGSLVRYKALFAAIKGTISCDTLKLELISTDGVVQDTVVVSRNTV